MLKKFVSENIKVVYGISSTKWTSSTKNPQQMKEEGHDQTYCWLLSFNFHLLVT